MVPFGCLESRPAIEIRLTAACPTSVKTIRTPDFPLHVAIAMLLTMCGKRVACAALRGTSTWVHKALGQCPGTAQIHFTPRNQTGTSTHDFTIAQLSSLFSLTTNARKHSRVGTLVRDAVSSQPEIRELPDNAVTMCHISTDTLCS